MEFIKRLSRDPKVHGGQTKQNRQKGANKTKIK